MVAQFLFNPEESMMTRDSREDPFSVTFLLFRAYYELGPK
jgi:hypothetical protein